MKKIVLTSCGVIDGKLKEQFYALLNKQNYNNESEYEF